MLLLSGAAAWGQFEVIPRVVDVEAGGNASQIIVRGPGGENLEAFSVRRGGRPDNFILVRKGGESADQLTVVLQARPDTPRGTNFALMAGTTRLPVQIRVVNPGEGVNTGATPGDTRELRDVLESAQEGQVVVSADQAPKVERTVPSPLRVAPTGQTSTLQIFGSRLEAIDDVRVRPADEPARYRGRQGKLPFRHRPGVLEVDVVAKQGSVLGETYSLDFMVGRFRVVTLDFRIGNPPTQPALETRRQHSAEPIVIELPPEASLGAEN